MQIQAVLKEWFRFPLPAFLVCDMYSLQDSNQNQKKPKKPKKKKPALAEVFNSHFIVVTSTLQNMGISIMLTNSRMKIKKKCGKR